MNIAKLLVRGVITVSPFSLLQIIAALYGQTRLGSTQQHLPRQNFQRHTSPPCGEYKPKEQRATSKARQAAAKALGEASGSTAEVDDSVCEEYGGVSCRSRRPKEGQGLTHTVAAGVKCA